MHPWLDGAIIAQIIGTATLLTVFLYLYNTYLATQKDRSYFLYWTIGWAFYLVRFIFEFIYRTMNPNPWFLFLYLSFAGIAAVFFLWAGISFKLDSRFKPWYALLISAAVIWPGFWTWYWKSGNNIVFPVFAFLGAVYIWTGLIFNRYRRRNKTTGATLLSISFILWGIHLLDYPLLYKVDWFAPYGYSLGAFFQLIIAISIIILVFEESLQEQRIAEKKLDESESFFRTVFFGIQDTINVVDCDKNIIYTNQGDIEYGRNGIMKCYQRMFKADEHCSPCPGEMTMKTGKPGFANFRTIDDDGMEKFYELFTFPMKSSDGQVDRIIEYVRDITERKQLEEKLIQAEGLAGIGEMAANMAHEIRNPLGSIVTASEVLSMDDSLVEDDDTKALLEVLSKESKRLNEILTDFLRYARPRAPQFEESDINELIRELVRGLEVDSSTNNINIILSLSESLPPAPLDHDQLKQAILNITKNAIEAMKGSGDLKITTENSDKDVRIIISDSGPGISSKDRAKIFQPFHTSRKEGTGLGLPIASRIVQAHGGTIQVESEIGQGSSFIILLPLDFKILNKRGEKAHG